MRAGPRLMARACAIALFLGTCGVVAPAMAQTAAGPRPSRLELSGGGVFVGGYGLGESKAELTPNSGSPAFEEFTTDNHVRAAFGVQARIGFVVTPAIVVEGGIRLTRPVYEVRVSGDVENAADITIEETLSQYLFDGSLVWQFSRTGRAVPFVYGGAGYLRELHEEDALVEEGVEYHAGAGLKWWFGQGRRRFGVRGEAGISIRDGGFDFKDSQRVVPVVGGSVIYTF
jgi:hypothetical protein